MKQSTQRNRQPGKRSSSRKAVLARAREAYKAARAATAASQGSPASETPLTSASDSPVTPANANIAEVIPVRESASKRKLNLLCSEPESPSPAAEDVPRYGIIDLRVLDRLFSKCVCSDCGCRLCVSSPTSLKKGFAFQLNVECAECQDTPVASTMSSPLLDDTAHYDINRRMVAAFLKLGLGFAALSSFCESIGLPLMQGKTFSLHVSAIADKTENFKEETPSSAVTKVRNHYGAGEELVLDVAVSFDGSWHKRGHISKHGVAAVIEAETGLVIDYHVMTTYCQVCQTVGAKMQKEGEARFDEWFEQHKPSCNINHSGSAGLMEVEAAGVLWNRSLERKLRYTTMISDGDCKTFLELQKNPPYDVPVEKEECTNHVAKRLGTGLRNLISDESKKGNPLGGRKQGSLTQNKINRLQTYYKKAVASQCSTVDELRQKIIATVDHASSTDEAPNHTNCPQGEFSWCFYNRGIHNGSTPPSHQGQSNVEISSHVAKFVRPIYERLTDDSLLKRCLKGFTQNANESLHSVIWAHCPKHLFVGKPRVSIATALGVGSFNAGSVTYRHFLRTIGLSVGLQTAAIGSKRDLKRISVAEKKETLEAKRRRLQITQARLAAGRENLRQEGPVYAAGLF